MKHSIVVKFLVILLAALSLTAAVGGAAGIVAIESAGLYISGLDELQNYAYDSISKDIASSYAELYAAENLGDLPYQLRTERYDDPADRSDAEHWYVTLYEGGNLLAWEGKSSASYAYVKEFTIAPLYATASLEDPDREQEPTEEETGEEPDTTSPTDITLPPEEPVETEPDNFLYSTQETVLLGSRLTTYYVRYYQAPEYTVTVCLREEVLESSSLYLLNEIYPHRYTFIFLLVFCLFLAAGCCVYLVNAAGCHADGSVRPGGLNRLPLDLYTLLCGGAALGLALLLSYLWEWMQNEGPHMGNLSLIGVNLFFIATVAVVYIFGIAAQAKAGNGYWWRHSFIGWLCGRVYRGILLLIRGGGAAIRLLPLIWQWVLAAGVLVLGLILFAVLSCVRPIFLVPLLLCAAGALALVVYAAYCVATLMKGTRRMSGGDLGSKVDTRHLRGGFLDFACQLNALSDAAAVVARKQMQSERSKSELITNVSHDIKTPLTSIINFVDLLQKPHTAQQEQEYLEVLRRQSSQMKKLITDLIDLSRASSGNIAVSLEKMDAVEAINQALGEFSDKLDAADLTPVVSCPQGPVYITADGRLSWRVVGNLLTNAVKYAMPGTRLYIDLARFGDTVLLSMKNISKEPLNMDADELMERFVRGDTSRNSEGSGLGLNIARTLMEVQGGKLQLLLDGDLFKVTLVFSAAE